MTGKPPPLAPVLILSGPSGTGKTRVIEKVMAQSGLPLHLSVSATTRPARPAERDGVHYHFWPRDRFEAEVRNEAFLEWAEVYGNLYGTLRSEVEPLRERGIGVILDIDTQGADQVRPRVPDHVSIFLKAPSMEAYRQRLLARGTEEGPDLERRLAGAERELRRANDYQYQVVNDDLERAVQEVISILRRAFAR